MRRVKIIMLITMLLVTVFVLPETIGQASPSLQETEQTLTPGKWTTGSVKFETTADGEYHDHAFEMNFEVEEDGKALLGTFLYSKTYGSLPDPSKAVGTWASRVVNGTIAGMTAFPLDGNPNLVTYINWAGLVKSPTEIEGILAIGWSNGRVIVQEVKFTAHPQS